MNLENARTVLTLSKILRKKIRPAANNSFILLKKCTRVKRIKIHVLLAGGKYNTQNFDKESFLFKLLNQPNSVFLSTAIVMSIV